MADKLRQIEIEEVTARHLDAAARARGVSVSDLVAELLQSSPVPERAPDVAELDRRWERVQAGEPTVAHEDVVRWLEVWGSPSGTPWRHG